MKILLYIVIALVALVGLLALVGSFMDPNHVAARKKRFLVPRERAWAVIRDFARHAEWRVDVDRVELVAGVGGKSGYREITGHGNVLYAIDVDEAPSKLMTRIADDSLPYGGAWTIEIETAEGGCDVTITERGFVKNPIFRFLSKTVLSPAATMEKYLEELETRLLQ